MKYFEVKITKETERLLHQFQREYYEGMRVQLSEPQAFKKSLEIALWLRPLGKKTGAQGA